MTATMTVAKALRAELSVDGKRRFAGVLSRELTPLQRAIRENDRYWGAPLVDAALRSAAAQANGDARAAEAFVAEIRARRRDAVRRIAEQLRTAVENAS